MIAYAGICRRTIAYASTFVKLDHNTCECGDCSGICSAAFNQKTSEQHNVQISDQARQRINRNRNKAIELRKKRLLSLAPVVHVDASQDTYLAPVTTLTHASVSKGTTDHRKRFFFGKNSEDSARKYTSYIK